MIKREDDHVGYFVDKFLETVDNLPNEAIDVTIQALADVRDNGGRVFVLGMGGSAGNASHMVNDLRKLCGIEAYAPTDNVSEFSAWVNDAGPDEFFVNYLHESKFNENDAIVVLSVGGGSLERKISVSLVNAIVYATEVGAQAFSIVGKADGYAAENTAAIVVPCLDPELVTPISEAMQAVVWHCIVSDPRLQVRKTTW